MSDLQATFDADNERVRKQLRVTGNVFRFIFAAFLVLAFLIDWRLGLGYLLGTYTGVRWRDTQQSVLRDGLERTLTIARQELEQSKRGPDDRR